MFATNHTILLERPASEEIGQFSKLCGTRYIIENVKEGLDSNGEWFWDDADNTLTVVTDADPSDFAVVAPQLPNLIHMYGSANVSIFDVQLRHTNDGSKRTDTYYSSDAAITIDHSSGIILDKINVGLCGADGILLFQDVQHFRLSNSAIRNIGGNGISVSQDKNVTNVNITNNLM